MKTCRGAKNLLENCGEARAGERLLIAYEPPEPVEVPAVNELASAEPVARGGDWRKAAKNITDGLDFHLNGAGANQATNHSS